VPKSNDQRVFRLSFSMQVFLGMAAGLLLGFIARGGSPDAPLGVALNTVGQSFVQLLKALVVPLVFTAIVGSVAALRELQGAGRLVLRTIAWFALTALIAVSIGIVLGLVIQPGVHAGIAASSGARPSSTGSWLDFLKGLVPANVLGLSASSTIENGKVSTGLSFNVLQIIVISLAVGIAAVRVGPPAAPFLSFVQSAQAIFRRILHWVIRLTPIGSAGLIGNAVARYGWDTLGSLGTFALSIYAGLALVLFGVYPALLLYRRLSPLRFFAAIWPALQIAFVSRSSIGTLPVTEELTEQALGVPGSYAAFAVPLGATTKMDGCAGIYPAVSAIFIAQFYGIQLHLIDYFLITFVAVAGSAATAGLTGATVMLTLSLSTLGLPMEGAGLLLAIDPILDMGRTAVNVAGQALVPTLVARGEGILDLTRFNSPRRAGFSGAHALAT
jgi:Na+/H+-dicarboxylate symporter